MQLRPLLVPSQQTCTGSRVDCQFSEHFPLYTNVHNHCFLISLGIGRMVVIKTGRQSMSTFRELQTASLHAMEFQLQLKEGKRKHKG